MNNIALLYFYGFGVRQSYSRAAKWLKMSADKGNPEAQNKLAGLYVDGLGVDRNPGRAKVLYLKSAVQGYVPAMVNLGGMLSQGSNGETRDLFPYPLVDRSNSVNASIDVEQALLRIPDLLVVESCCRGVRERRTLECP
jgi:TPR repeat protein